jgi:hypothetical protein
VWKNRIIAFAIGLALGILGTAGTVLIGQSGGAGGLAGLDRANQLETARTVAGLERTVGEQRERINHLEANNSRLEKHIGDARGVVEQLTISTGTEAADIRGAIELLKTITDQVKSLDGILGGGDTAGGWGGDIPGIPP